MAGRGRGRGRGLLSSNVTPVTPGGGEYKALLVKLGHIKSDEDIVSSLSTATALSSNQTSSWAEATIDEVEEQVSGMQLDIEEPELGNIKLMATEAAKVGEDVKKISDFIYKKCLGDREFAKSGALVCAQLSGLEVDGVKFRTCILALLQRDFKDKEELKKMSSTRFLGFLATLCQVFCYMRTATDEIFKPLVGPICESMELILSEDKESSADECEFVFYQLQTIGKDLEEVGAERFAKFMEKVRSKIVNNGTSPRIRCTLLELLECYLRKFDEFPNDVTRFYCETSADILTGLLM